jgi:lysozyme
MSRFEPGLLARAVAFIGARPRPSETILDEPSAVQVAISLAQRFEGFYGHPYLCPAGVPTIGYGATHYLDGRRVKLTDPPISREAAERLLLRQIEQTYLPAVRRQCPGLTEPRRLAAIIDFTFNLGEGQLRSSTLRRKINDGAWHEVPAQLMRWNKAGGRVLTGLTRRRVAEVELI